ncbi:hypothetical protein ACFRFH_04620 [Leifsonia sp. NPDC056824]|uniref:hypothetical protein n=1 Tax=Leifsonia sp. NPDC056824 TaxID=3345953 RepID=UPI00367C896D
MKDPAITSPRLARVGGWFGIAGPVLLAASFVVTAFAGRPPFAVVTASQLMTSVRSHETLFSAGAWLLVTGTLLSAVFFLVLVTRTGKGACFIGQLVTVGVALLIGVAVVEAALLIAVPTAAAARSTEGTLTALTLSGVFARVSALATAPPLFAATGLALRFTSVLPRAFGPLALVIAGLFVASGIVAIFSEAGLIAAVAVSVLQEAWIVAAAVALLLRARGSKGLVPEHG